MSPKDDKYLEHLIERFRQLSASTTKWVLLYLVALIYTWFSSIYPRQRFLENYVTILHRQDHFDSLITHTKKAKVIYLSESGAYLKKTPNLLRIAKTDNVRENIRKRSSLLNNIIQKAKMSNERRDTLKQDLIKLSRLKGKNRRLFLAAIKENFFEKDIIIGKSELQKADAQRSCDSLKNKIPVTFNIPGVNKVEFGFRDGLVFWMVLNLILLLYVFSMKQKMRYYLREIYINKKAKTQIIGDWEKLDLQTPILLAPIYYKNDTGSVLRNMVGWNFGSLNNLLGLSILSLVIVLQLHVAWLSWHVSIIRYFESSLFEAVSVVLVFASVFPFFLLLRPLTLPVDFDCQKSFSFGRREVLKLGVSGLLFLVILPPVGKKIPLLRGSDLGYTRVKRKNKYKIDIPDGFYVNNHKGKRIVHYFSNGISLSMKSIDESKMKILIPKMKAITIDELILNSAKVRYKIPHWAFILEKEAHKRAKDNDYLSAAKILLFALQYSESVKSDQPEKIINSSSKLTPIA